MIKVIESNQGVQILWFYGLHLFCFHFLLNIINSRKTLALRKQASHKAFKGIEASTVVFEIEIYLDLDHH